MSVSSSRGEAAHGKKITTKQVVFQPPTYNSPIFDGCSLSSSTQCGQTRVWIGCWDAPPCSIKSILYFTIIRELNIMKNNLFATIELIIPTTMCYTYKRPPYQLISFSDDQICIKRACSYERRSFHQWNMGSYGGCRESDSVSPTQLNHSFSWRFNHSWVREGIKYFYFKFMSPSLFLNTIKSTLCYAMCMTCSWQ